MTLGSNRRRTIATLVSTGAGLALPGWAGPAFAQVGRREPYRIFMITWRGWEDGSQGFEDYLRWAELPIELIVRDAGTDAKLVEEHVREAKALRPDLVYTWGTTTALTTFGRADRIDPERHITDIPGVFNIVSTPLESGLIESYERPRDNLTGTLYLVPVETQLKTIESYGGIENLGVVFNASENNSRLAVNQLRESLARRDLPLLEKVVPFDVEGKPIAAKISDLVRDLRNQGADWLYIPPDSFLNVNREQLTGTARDVGLPSFASAENFVRSAHGLVGLVSRYYVVGQYAGYLAEQILVHGKKPVELPIQNLERFSLLVNRETARNLNYYPPFTMLSIAEFV